MVEVNVDELDIAILIPALNEELAIARTLKRIPLTRAEIIVIDNGSTDNTASIAKDLGATVVFERRKGYGFACLAGIEYISSKNIPPEYVVFLDADDADNPNEMLRLIQRKFAPDKPDLVIGSRLEKLKPGAMSAHSIIANKVFTKLIRFLYGLSLTDMGSMRVIKLSTLQQLGMQDTGYGWTAEMIVKCLNNRFTIAEVQVEYSPRIGVSKISGSLITSFKAAIWITIHIFTNFIRR